MYVYIYIYIYICIHIYIRYIYIYIYIHVYDQLLELDVAVLRHQGCMMHLKCEVTRRWFCDRYKTGQRLANAFAVGLPTVLWHEQGFLDIVSGSGYPAVARTVKEAVGWVRRIVADDGLRADLRRRALALAAPYAPRGKSREPGFRTLLEHGGGTRCW